MNFLVDMPISPEVARWLNEKGHDSVHASHVGLDRTKDKKIIEIAKEQNRIIITADLDFPQILALSGARTPGIILFRGGNYSESEMLSLIARVIERFSESELVNSISVVDRTKIRRIKLPIESTKTETNEKG
jgi:predicted nuclease of predicted toxin-antitoxin system